MATKRSNNKDGDKRRQEHGDKRGEEQDKRIKVTASVEGI